MLITFGIHLYDICTKNVFLICLVYYFRNCAAIIKKKKKSLWFQSIPLSKYPYIDANHYDFSVIVTNFGPKLRCYGQQTTCYGFPIIAVPEPLLI